jgi:hypothetical protein
VKDEEFVVYEPNIEFDRVNSETKRALEGRNRVLGFKARGAAVAYD